MCLKSTLKYSEKEPPCNVEDNLRAGLIAIEAWSGATEGVLDYGVLGRPDYGTWAGLMGCEDTKIEDSTRIRMGCEDTKSL